MANTVAHGEQSFRREIGPRLGGEIDAARQRVGLTFREAAARIGISYGYLAELCQGRRCPSRGVAAAIIAVLPMTREAAEELMAVAVERRDWQQRDQPGF